MRWVLGHRRLISDLAATAVGTLGCHGSRRQIEEAATLGWQGAGDRGTVHDAFAPLPHRAASTGDHSRPARWAKDLVRLAELHKTGELTDHEFAAAKATLVGLPADHSAVPSRRAADEERAVVFRRALMAMADGDTGTADDVFTEDLVGWSPLVRIGSKADLIDLLGEQDDAFSGIKLKIDTIDILGSKGIGEWRLKAVFSGPYLLADDVLIEPTGQRVLIAGVSIAEFRGDQIYVIRQYFDEATLLEQILASR